MILATSFAFVGFSNRITDCAYSPAGELRWSALDEWFINPNYHLRERPACDVWNEVTPKLPLGTIQLEDETHALGPIVARIHPDGSGFVAVFKPYRDDLHKLYSDQGFSPKVGFAHNSTVFEFERDQPLRKKVETLLGPMRDFRGNLPFDDFESLDLAEFERDLLQLDATELTDWVCRREPEMSPWVGQHIVFGSATEGGDPRFFGETRCDDIAYRAMAHRHDTAFELLIDAAHAREFIENETSENYPECRTGEIACFESLE